MPFQTVIEEGRYVIAFFSLFAKSPSPNPAAITVDCSDSGLKRLHPSHLHLSGHDVCIWALENLVMLVFRCNEMEKKKRIVMVFILEGCGRKQLTAFKQTNQKPPTSTSIAGPFLLVVFLQPHR